MKELLDFQYERFNAQEYLDIHPDPVIVARRFSGHDFCSEIAFICACYAYGNAKALVKNLESMPFYLFDSKNLISSIEAAPIAAFPYYRFQTRLDTKLCFLVLASLLAQGGLYAAFRQGYKRANAVLDGLESLHACLRQAVSSLLAKPGYLENLAGASTPIDLPKISRSLGFLFGGNKTSALKRSNLFLRWMVRRDYIDLGLWDEVSASDLLLPLDTHTFRICSKLGLCKTKSPNRRAALEISARLREFDPKDPIKYDFALYRIGQLKDSALEALIERRNA